MYLSIKEIGLNSNVVGQVAISLLVGSASHKVNASLVFRIICFIGTGNLNIGIDVENPMSGSTGYALSTKLKNNK